MGTGTEERLRGALHAALYSMTPEARRDREYSMADAAVLLDTSAKTLERARAAQVRAMSSTPPARIDPLSFEALSFALSATGSGRYVCNADSVFQLFKRRRERARAEDERLAAAMGINAVLAFQAWTSVALADESWPFSIQDDGRPLDFVAALTLDKLTGEVEWLTLREFTDKLANAVAKASSMAEKQCISDDEGILRGRRSDKDDGRL